MKRNIALMLAVIMLLSLTGCGKTEGDMPAPRQTEAPTAEPSFAPTSIPEPVPEVTETPAPADYSSAYADVIALYKKAIDENWDMQKCYDGGVNYLIGMIQDKSTIGYCLYDLDGDKISELFIGSIDRPEIYAMYTLDLNCVPVQLVDAGERSSYYLEPDGAIVNRGSGSAFLSAYRILEMKKGAMELLCALVADYSVNENEPWFLAKDDDWDVRNDEKISNERAETAIKAYEDNYVFLPYLNF